MNFMAGRCSPLTAGLLIVCGCSSGPVDPLELAYVNGTVTFNGKALSQAQVLFIPEEPGKMSAHGVTDEAGQFQLGTRLPGDGAVIGRHRVAITARGPDKVLPPDQLATGLPGSNTAPGEPLIPPHYFSPGTSGLTAEVTGGRNAIDFALTGAKRP